MRLEQDQSISIAYAINDIARYYKICVDREMAKHGLTRSQWWLLANLQYNDGVIQQELAELLDMGKSAVGKLIDQLEKKEWVRRVQSETDRRAYKVFLTKKVRPLSKTFDKQAHLIIDRSLSDLSPSQRNQLQKLAESVRARLQAMTNE